MSDQYVGEIRMFAGNYAPQGWAMCNGQVLPITQNEALYTLIGTTYGGDGRTTFQLPDLRGRVPIHMGTSSSGTAYSLGQMGGTEQVTLTAAQLPVHTHAASAQAAAATTTNPTGNVWASTTIDAYANAAPNKTMNSALVSSVGGTVAHDNMMPFFTITFIIAMQGIFPTQG